MIFKTHDEFRDQFLETLVAELRRDSAELQPGGWIYRFAEDLATQFTDLQDYVSTLTPEDFRE